MEPLTFSFRAQDLLYLLPEGILVGFGLLLLLADPFLPPPRKTLLGTGALIGLLASAVATGALWSRRVFLFDHLFTVDAYAVFFKLIFLAAAVMTLLVSFRYLKALKALRVEYFVLLLFAAVGMMVTASGSDLLSIYLGLELMTISSYALVGFLKKREASLEGALKFFILGAFNSGVLLYGIALLYGFWATTDLSKMHDFLIQGPPPKMLLVGKGLLLCGLAFKISAFPFHMWVPDAYEGSPTPIAGFISVASKAAGFAALLRVVTVLWNPLFGEWQTFIVILSILTMTVGNLLALSQENLKRMLAYSSIAHAGYLLMGVAAGSPIGLFAVLFYFIAYALMNLGAFFMMLLLPQENAPESIDCFKGLAQKHPFWGLCLLLFFISLAGIPPSAGFVGKFYLFASAIQSRLYLLAVIGILNNVLALVYYFRVVRGMYMLEESRPVILSAAGGLRLVLIVLAVLTLLVGLYPAPFLRIAYQAGGVLL
ncbi:MAG: NADH-quinone oxidoreductase subunit N [Candidatus Omnitrophota bacterium]